MTPKKTVIVWLACSLFAIASFAFTFILTSTPPYTPWAQLTVSKKLLLVSLMIALFLSLWIAVCNYDEVLAILRWKLLFDEVENSFPRDYAERQAAKKPLVGKLEAATKNYSHHLEALVAAKSNLTRKELYNTDYYSIVPMSSLEDISRWRTEKAGLLKEYNADLMRLKLEVVSASFNLKRSRRRYLRWWKLLKCFRVLPQNPDTKNPWASAEEFRKNLRGDDEEATTAANHKQLSTGLNALT